MPLLRWMMPVDCAPSSPDGRTFTCLMCLAQLGHSSTRARYCHACFNDRFTVNSRRSSVIIAAFKLSWGPELHVKSNVTPQLQRRAGPQHDPPFSADLICSNDPSR